MRVAWMLGLIMLVAGCVTVPAGTEQDLGAVLSPPIFEKVLSEALPWTAEDGVTLDAWVFRPDVGSSDEKVPIIINYSPYWSNLAPPAAEGGDAFSLYLIEHFVPRGYAVALVSVRGTGLSEGCFWIGGPQEIDDTDKMSTFLAEQPWSNGNVAAVAKSYDGTVAQMLLTRENPHVKTIVPVSPISEWYKYEYYGGVVYAGSEAFNPYYLEAVSIQATSNEDPGSPTWERMPTRFCEETADVNAAQLESNLAGNYNAYWQERNYTAMLPDTVTASVFYVHGLQDWNVKPDHMVPWIPELRERGALVKMQLGQWAHDYSHRDDWNTTFLRWLDSELKGIDNGIRSEPLVEVQDDAGVWRHEDDWPPTRATPLTLYPSADGALGAEPGTGSSQYADAPYGAANVPLFGPPAGEALAPRPMGGVTFDMKVEEGFRIVGVPVLTATVSATGPRATLAAALLVDGKVVDQGFLDLAHRDSLESPAPLTPGQTYQVSVPFYPQDLVVPAGSTLSLYVSALEPADALVQISPYGSGGVVTLTHGEGTALTLPTVAIDDVRIEARQPEDVGCWTC